MRYANASLYFSRGWYGAQVEVGKKQNKKRVSANIHGILNVKGVKEAIKRELTDVLGGVDFSKILSVYWKRRNLIPRSHITMKLVSPLAIGMGEDHALDIPGIVLHRNYGFPYIPGSGVRGMVRSTLSKVKVLVPEKDKQMFSMMEHYLFGNVFNLGKRDLENKTFKGVLHFLSTVPVKGEQRLIEGDIINNHHGEYYKPKNNKPPIDTEEPNPVNFLRVPADTTFEFAWVIDEDYDKRWQYLKDEYKIDISLSNAILEFAGSIIEATEWKDDIKDASIDSLVKLMLQITGRYFGFGAKTRVGYGRFK